jgi:hypothetical protein
MNGDNLKNLRQETSMTLGNKKREYMNYKINELETDSKNKHIIELHRFTHSFTQSKELRRIF